MMEVAYDKEWGNDEDAEQQTAWDSNSDRS